MRGRDVSQLLAVLPLVGVLPACAGAMLRDMPMHGGDRKSESRSHDVTLNALGINRMASHRWQTMGATLEATAAAAGVDPATVMRWTRGESAFANAKAEGKDGKKYPTRYKPQDPQKPFAGNPRMRGRDANGSSCSGA